MENTELRTSLETRRRDLNLSYKDIKQRTQLGYNTVRRAFKDPFAVNFKTVLMICETMGCTLMMAVENKIPDEIESGTQPSPEKVIEELKHRDPVAE